MPKLWNETIEAHRTAVRDATMDTTAALVAERGLTGVTMSQIAERTGIGRATLYKYFPDVESILAAWHERQVGAHLAKLTAAPATPGDPAGRLAAVLDAYALIQYEHPVHALAAVTHRGGHVPRAEQHLTDFLTALIAAAAATGDLRTDVPAAELARFCLAATAGARGLPSKAAVHRLVRVTLSGLRPAR
ncbi:TetR/AcrR family transcriptional regulator [Actinacidiphila paucisporea]|uniref:Transcriptional regulator, TetR family n=1 Tax=Actinacidiphila paucisporea TaxID=310782 RepID=A0A1M6Z3V1_9ACTN|nr:TetR/AcrR family transcriptional regulator [Actinacidiphila paucisporea]SHL25216.1 transcriptional regulator, TetR family [Actinacidiphila paucisporea]